MRANPYREYTEFYLYCTSRVLRLDSLQVSLLAFFQHSLDFCNLLWCSADFSFSPSSGDFYCCSFNFYCTGDVFCSQCQLFIVINKWPNRLKEELTSYVCVALLLCILLFLEEVAIALIRIFYWSLFAVILKNSLNKISQQSLKTAYQN